MLGNALSPRNVAENITDENGAHAHVEWGRTVKMNELELYIST